MLISYYIMVLSKMAANMAAVTLRVAYLLNYLLEISREGVYHWVFWRHIYLYQIKVHILMMSSRNPRWRPRLPPLPIDDHNSLRIHPRKEIFVSIPRF